MRRKRGADKPEPEVPVSSFSDIAFLLIIFFILATTLTQLRGFYTEIPAGAKSEAQEQDDKTTTVNVHDGRVNLNDEEVSIEAFRERLREMNLHDKIGNSKVVIVETSGKVNYQLYYQVMTIITNAGGAIAMVDPDSED